MRRPRTRAEPVGDVFQRVERRPRVERALGVVRIVDRIARLPHVPRAVVLADPVRGRGIELPAVRLVHGREQQPLVAGELLVGVAGARRVHDRHQVVGAEAALDELLAPPPSRAAIGRSACAGRRSPSRRRARRTVARCVFTSGSIGEAANSGRSARSTGMSTMREHADRLGLPVLEDLEIFLLQIADVVAPAGR